MCRSATAAAASVNAFTLYGSLPLAISRATAGCASATPKRSPAMPKRLGEGAQHDQPRGRAASSGSGRRAAELLVRLVAHHQRAGLGQHPLDRARRAAPSRWVVGRVEHDDPGALAHRGLDQRVHVVREVRPERHRHGSARRARRSAAGTARTSAPAPRPRRPAPSVDRERRLDQLVRPVAHEDPVRRASRSARPAAASSSGRHELRIAVPRRAAMRLREHLALERPAAGRTGSRSG